MPPAPHQSATQTIQRLIEAQYTIEREIRQHLEFNTGNLVAGLSFAVTLQDANLEGLNGFQVALRTYFLSDDSSFKRMKVRQLLDDLLAADSHLNACCQTPWGLARAIEVLSPIAIRASGLSWDEGGQEIAVARMLGILYETEYQRETYIHLYNFDIEQVPLALSMFNAEVVRLSVNDLPRLIGETTFTSALHDPQTGRCFTKFVDRENLDDNTVFQRSWQSTHAIVQMLRYFKYGIIDMDYGGIYYMPAWVNEIRRVGIRIWGLPRKDRQGIFYALANSDRPKLEAYGQAYQKLKPLIDNVSGSLRQATSFAGNYFEGHNTHTKLEEKLIDLVIALEVLFSPGKEGELRFRIAQRAAILLGKTADDRISIKDFLVRVYDARSGLVHSGESPFSPTAKEKLTSEDLARLGDYVRQAILGLFVVHWRGETDKKKVHNFLDKCALDESAQKKLFSDADFDSALPSILSS